MIKTSLGLPRKSSTIFRNLWKFLEKYMTKNVRLAFETSLENLQKSLESGLKLLANCQKRHHRYVYNIYNKNNTTCQLEDMNFMYLWQEQVQLEQYPICLLGSLMRYYSGHSNIKFISSCHCVITSISIYKRALLYLEVMIVICL